jgi:hypothetical protein
MAMTGEAQTRYRDKTLTEKLTTPVSPDLLKKVEDYRFGGRFRTQSEAVRSLISAGLEAERKRSAK